jgi:hypothetical protein
MEKSNQQRLEEYLVGNEKSYLKSDISNGKVIMLSGKWGSGKTHFWKNIIEKNLKKEKIPNNYISLYGKTSIQEIKNEVFLKIFESMDIFKIDDKSFGLAKDTANLITDITKSVSVFGFNLDLSKIVDKSFEKLEKVKEEKKEKDIKNTLNSGAIICFDDFERKSRDIDLNDLFGFITNLTIEFDCKVVIILNDDVFEGEEKKIFSNVKEKSVSKFLKYEPKIKELFETIFSDNRYRILDDYKDIILKTIEEIQELNARIYIQVLDNLVEWIGNKQEMNDVILRYLIFININFILYHCHFIEKKMNDGKVFFIKELDYISHKNFQILSNDFFNILNKKEINVNLIIDEITTSPSMSQKNKLIDFINDNKIYIKIWYLFYKYKINHIDVNNIFFDKINNFIETGILINE